MLNPIFTNLNDRGVLKLLMVGWRWFPRVCHFFIFKIGPLLREKWPKTCCKVRQYFSVTSWMLFYKRMWGMILFNLTKIPKNNHVKGFLGSILTPTWVLGSFLTPAGALIPLGVPMFRAWKARQWADSAYSADLMSLWRPTGGLKLSADQH